MYKLYKLKPIIILDILFRPSKKKKKKNNRLEC